MSWPSTNSFNLKFTYEKIAYLESENKKFYCQHEFTSLIDQHKTVFGAVLWQDQIALIFDFAPQVFQDLKSC